MISVLEKPVPFGGGIQLSPNKEMSLQRPLSSAALPELLTLPLRQHAGMAATPLVRPGDRVFKGQLIAEAHGFISASVHASSSGLVREIAEHEIPSPSREKSPCVVIETDGEDRWFEVEREPVEAYTQVSPVEIQHRIMQAGIVGLGGAGFPSAVKLIPGLNLDIELLIINAAECDPYISCDEALIRYQVDELITGVDILAHALQVDACVIAIEENKSKAIAILEQALAETSYGIQLKKVSTLYPAGGERQLIKSITGMAVPADGLPVDIGVVCYNAGTAFAVKKAIIDAEPLIERVVTVTGTGVAQPGNMRVRLGTPLNRLIEESGGYTDQYQYLVMGGPMMGMRLENDGVPVIKTTNCLLAVGHDQAHTSKPEQPCIRCDECAVVCPAGLQPQQLHWHIKVFNEARLQDFRLFDCIECGCCSYVCPSHIPLVERYRLAKSKIWEEHRQRLDAEQSRRRFETKQGREKQRQQEKRLQREQRTGKTVTVTDDKNQKQREIAAAVNRVRKKRAEKEERE